jgi:hypothetical protein
VHLSHLAPGEDVADRELEDDRDGEEDGVCTSWRGKPAPRLQGLERGRAPGTRTGASSAKTSWDGGHVDEDLDGPSWRRTAARRRTGTGTGTGTVAPRRTGTSWDGAGGANGVGEEDLLGRGRRREWSAGGGNGAGSGPEWRRRAG